jgi:branched-chain amino acid aminotransferase
MAKYNNDNRLIFLNDKILNVNDAKINVLSPTSQFGVNVFEGIRCYWNENKQQLFAFRLHDHYKRLKTSQRLLKMEDRYTIDELKKAFVDTVTANNYKEDIAVRQTLFIDGFGSWSSSGPVNMFISPIPKTKTSSEYNKKGLNCCVSSWQRINDNAVSPRIKCGANYINSRMAQLDAINNGYDTAIFLNNHGYVSEGPGSCLFIVRDNKLVTPLITDSILESITRDTIIKLAKDIIDIDIIERNIDRTELYMCQEAFLCGSSMEITPILSIDGYIVGDGTKGKTTKRLHDEYSLLVTGRHESKFNQWITSIY